MKITEKDFNYLRDAWMDWGQDWKVQSERFDADVSFDWQQSYWFNSYANIILARTFLDDQAISYQISSDETGGWVLLTNYNDEMCK